MTRWMRRRGFDPRAGLVFVLTVSSSACAMDGTVDGTEEGARLAIFEPLDGASSVVERKGRGMSALAYRVDSAFPASDVRSLLASRVPETWVRRVTYRTSPDVALPDEERWVPGWRSDASPGRWDLDWVAQWDGPGGDSLQLRLRYEIAGTESTPPTGTDGRDLLVVVEWMDAETMRGVDAKSRELASSFKSRRARDRPDCVPAHGSGLILRPVVWRESCVGMERAQLGAEVLCFSSSDVVVDGGQFCASLPMVARRFDGEDGVELPPDGRAGLVLLLTESGQRQLADWTAVHPEGLLALFLSEEPIATMVLSSGAKEVPLLTDAAWVDRLSEALSGTRASESRGSGR